MAPPWLAAELLKKVHFEIASAPEL